MTRASKNRVESDNVLHIPLMEQQRKQPQQARSIALVDAIKQTARALLENEGRAALTLYRLSETSGVAISSIYEYFPTMDALVAAIFEDYRNLMQIELLAEIRAMPAGTTLYQEIVLMFDVFLRFRQKQLLLDPALSGKSMRQSELHRLDLAKGGSLPPAQVTRELLDRFSDQIAYGDKDKLMFIVYHTMQAITRVIALERPNYLAEPDTVTMLAGMMYGLMTGAGKPPAR